MSLRTRFRRIRILTPTILVAGSIAAAALMADATGAFQDGKGPQVDPDLGLSDAERFERHTALRGEFEKRLAAWRASFEPESVDVGGVEHYEMLSQYPEPHQTFAASVAHADVAVLGEVSGLRTDEFGSVVTLKVTQTLKGTVSGETVLVRQASGFWPAPDWKGVFIQDDPGDPLLLPGQRVLLLLVATTVPGAPFEVQPATGQYELRTDGGVTALATNPFRSEVDGRSEQSFVADVGEAARANR